MATIARTNKYYELVLRHLELIRLYSSMSELRLRTNKSVDPDLAKYYLNCAINQYPGFFVPALESMRRSFYVSLKAVIGAYHDTTSQSIKRTKNDTYSLAQYLYDGSRKHRKKSAIEAFETLLIHNSHELKMLKNLRDGISHNNKKAKTNNLIIFGEAKTIEILNSIGDVLYLLGFRRWNTPHHFSYSNEWAEEIGLMIDALLIDEEDVEEKREKYITKRAEWIAK